LSSSGLTRLEIYALTGQRVATLVAEPQAPGSHLVTWDGRADDGQAVATGIYLVRLESLAGTQVLKVSLLR
jgi:flagellar hook assembly protein FlgD